MKGSKPNMFRITVIGSVETTDKVKEVAKEFDDKIEFEFLKYMDKEETLALTKIAQENSDLIVYSGMVPYNIAEKAGILRKPAIYIQRNGTSLYQAFWKIRDDAMPFSNMSVDALYIDEIKEAAGELDIRIDNIYVNDRQVVIDSSYDKLISFHLDLWQSGKIDIALTGFSKVFHELRKLGVPCYRLIPTKSLIRNNLKDAISLRLIEKAEDTQTAVQIIKLRIDDGEMDADIIRAELESILDKYARENLGSLYSESLDEFLIFTNKGSLVSKSNCFDIRKELSFYHHNTILSSGIGYGDNVREAENKARIALKHALEKTYSCIYLVDNNNRVTGPISSNKEENITFDLSAGKDDKIRGIAEKTGLSPVYVSKLQNLMEKLDQNILDVHSVKDFFGINERSARRILGKLVESGAAEVKYTESKAKTGRPRKKYKINF